MKLWRWVVAAARYAVQYPEDLAYGMISGLVVFLLALTLAVALTIASGCASATQEVSRRAQAVQVTANAGKEELRAALDTGEVGPAAEPHVVAADGAFDAIKKDAAAVQDQVPKIRDIQSPWVGLLKLWGVIVLVAAVLFSSIYWGWGTLLRPIFHAAGRLIPDQTWTEAKLHSEALAEGSIQKLREAVASRRTHDTAYDAAFKISKGGTQA